MTEAEQLGITMLGTIFMSCHELYGRFLCENLRADSGVVVAASFREGVDLSPRVLEVVVGSDSHGARDKEPGQDLTDGTTSSMTFRYSWSAIGGITPVGEKLSRNP